LAHSNGSSDTGYHWCSLVIKNKKCLFVNSFGNVVPEHIYNKILINKSIEQFGSGQIHYQDDKDDHCGWYCIALLNFLKDFDDIFIGYDQFTKLFNIKNLKNNKLVLMAYLNNYINYTGSNLKLIK